MRAYRWFRPRCRRGWTEFASRSTVRSIRIQSDPRPLVKTATDRFPYRAPVFVRFVNSGWIVAAQMDVFFEKIGSPSIGQKVSGVQVANQFQGLHRSSSCTSIAVLSCKSILQVSTALRRWRDRASCHTYLRGCTCGDPPKKLQSFIPLSAP